MDKKTRQILFYTLVGVFFVAGYLTLLFAFGYTYDFKQNQFIKTGSVYLSMNVSSSITIGGSTQKETGLLRNDFSKKYLLPGIYNVEVSKEGYQTWAKKVQIPAGLVSSFNNIILVPEDTTPITLFPNLADLYTDNSGSSAFYIDSNQQFGFVDYDKSEVKPFFSRLTFAPKIVSWDETNEQIFVSNFATSKILGDEEVTLHIPSTLLNSSLVLRDEYLISKAGQNILIYNHEEGSFNDSIRNVSSFHIEKDIIYFINSKDFLLYGYDLNDKEAVLVSGADNFRGGELLEVSKVDDDYYALIKAGAQKLIFKINLEEVSLIAGNVRDYKLSYDNRILAWWDSEGISIYWLEDTRTQPFRVAEETERILLLKGINDVHWHKQNGHLVIFTNRLVVFSEIDTRSTLSTTTLYDLFRDYDFQSKSSQVIANGVYNSELDAVYFTIGSDLLRISLEK